MTDDENEPFDYGERRDDGQYENHPTVDDGEFVRPIRMTYRHDRCDGTTTMARELAESYAREPSFYDKTFCVVCEDYFPVGPDGEFVWDDGSDKRVGE